MSKPFICFESGSSLFLISLEWIWHILRGPLDGQEAVEYGRYRIPARDFCSLWGSEPECRGRYAVLLQNGEARGGFLASRIEGVYSIEEEAFQAIPREAVSPENTFLRAAARPEGLGRWAFLVDVEEILGRFLAAADGEET